MIHVTNYNIVLAWCMLVTITWWIRRINSKVPKKTNLVTVNNTYRVSCPSLYHSAQRQDLNHTSAARLPTAMTDTKKTNKYSTEWYSRNSSTTKVTTSRPVNRHPTHRGKPKRIRKAIADVMMACISQVMMLISAQIQSNKAVQGVYSSLQAWETKTHKNNTVASNHADATQL